MKKHISRLSLALVALFSVVGCGKSNLSDEEFVLVTDELLQTMPFIIDKTTSDTIFGNEYRAKLDLTTPELKDGNDLILLTDGIYDYENEEEGIFLSGKFDVDWSFSTAYDFVGFDIEKDDRGILTAAPKYPTYKPDYDGSGKALHEVPDPVPARLVAEIKVGNKTRRANFDLILHSIELLEWYRLFETRDLKLGSTIGVRGYVTGIFPDWNNATINDGDDGFGLFKIQDYEDTFEVGDLVEAVGQFTVYNGLAQIQYIKRIKIVDPSAHPNIKKPEYNEFTIDDIADQFDRASTDLTGPLQDKDGALVKFDKPFKLVEVRDRDKQLIEISAMDVSGRYHTDIIVEAETTDYTEVEKVQIKLSVNYHMGGENQKAIRDFFITNGKNPFYYEGHLSAYNEFILGPYDASALKLTPSA